MLNVEDSIQFIKGVGPKRCKAFEKLGVKSIGDLVWYFPRDYEDRADIKKINQLIDSEKQTFKAKVLRFLPDVRVRKNMIITKAQLIDETGSVTAVWFNSPFIKRSIKLDKVYTFYGKIYVKYNNAEVNSPVFEDNEITDGVNVGLIVPKYQLIADLNESFFRKVINTAINEVDGKLEDYLPKSIKNTYKLCDINFAIKNIHFPQDFDSLKIARRRLAFDELLILQLGLFISKGFLKKEEVGIVMNTGDDFTKLVESLPFKLTDAQNKVTDEIVQDISSGKVMNRLVQGDVGSGKTIIAILLLYVCTRNGFQGVMMAPTEILANQHYESLLSIFKNYDLNIESLTGSTKPKEKKRILEELKEGKINILIGTHALIEDNVEFNKLGVVITDEQHRFGVRQRAILADKGNTAPHVLVMTATPIPRTLSLILYGDLDISVIDQLPPGRKEIKTYFINSSYVNRMYGFIKNEIKSGRQVYYVCPLVEESENISAKSVNEIFEMVSKEFEGFRIAILHGKMKQIDKAQVMDDFKKGNIDILISTTVIEVGVNVPNASIMVVQNAERFGLAQLHQLRGRVGRGEYQSHCILISDAKGKIIESRMKVMCQTNNGFIISEKDLELRGPGEMFGTRQHGVPELKIANLFEDVEELKCAQECAEKILSEDSYLKNTEYKKLKAKLIQTFNKKIDSIIMN